MLRKPNLICVDVDYRESIAVAAGVLFHAWGDEVPAKEATVTIREVQPYQPGQFFRRELPCLVRVLDALGTRPDTVIIDGYVWLGSTDRPGLGAFLFETLSREAAVIGVAKRRFRDWSSSQQTAGNLPPHEDFPSVLARSLTPAATCGECARCFGSTNAVEVFRGRSRSPLYVTAAGMDSSEAAGHIRSMHGKYRIPTLLKRVDRLSRSSTVYHCLF